MKSIKWFILIIGLFTFLIPTTSLSAPDRRTALVIGNGAYKSSPLRNPVNDASDFADALQNLGFSVILKTNADQRTMEESIRYFGKKLRSGGVGLFYFAGHGLQINGRNYLIPIGADLESEADVKYEGVDAGRVLAQMEEAENGLNIIILDACRDNPFARSFRSSDRGLAKMDAPEGSILAYATAPGSIAADGSGRNGLYTSKLLKHINSSGLPVELFFKEVRRDVRNESGRKQIPWTESSLVGDFYFNPKRGIAVVEPPSTEPQKSVKETQKYASISSDVLEPKVVARDGHYIKYDSGVVYDKNTGLEWYAGPDNNTTWDEAKRWIASLNVDGGGWRMPTREELKRLYQRGTGSRNMTSLLETTGRWVWSGETKDSASARDFYFATNRDSWYSRNYASGSIRGFAVRSRR